MATKEAIVFAKKYLEDLLSFFGVNAEVEAICDDGDVIELHIPSTEVNGFLIGQDGETVRSLQYIVSTVLRNNNHMPNRVNIDVADYKKQRAERLKKVAEGWVAKVLASGVEMSLEPMNAADRRTVHQLAAESGITTESVGEGQGRHIVLKP